MSRKMLPPPGPPEGQPPKASPERKPLPIAAVTKLPAPPVPPPPPVSPPPTSEPPPETTRTSFLLESSPFIVSGKRKGGKWVWVKDELRVFKPRFVIPQESGSTLVDEAGSVFKYEDVTFIDNPSNLDRTEDDLVHLEEVNEPFILHSIGSRFVSDQIYTNLGSIVISVNPFQWIKGLYGPEIIEKYARIGRQGILMPPHIYTIADAALCAIVENGGDQSIIISGESGAGKTEAVKKCLEYLATVAGSSVKNVEERILSANPVLEAFGNATTNRNNNSSRFGKWMQIHFSSSAKIIGCSNTSYLLEKTRVVHQDSGERNFHIFYLLVKGASADMLEELRLTKDPSAFKYMNQSGKVDADGIDDTAWFNELNDSFHSLGFDDTEVDGIYKCIAGILLLGNITFESADGDDEKCKVNEANLVEDAANVLGIDPIVLNTCLVERLFVSGGRSSMIKVPMKKLPAKENRDALCKELYARLFLWLVARVNKAMAIDGKTSTKIGVLDIFGFEIFEKNSFEQLCINFANEKLQQHFTNYTFKMENEVYRGEGINFKGVPFIDNQKVLDFLELRRSGLFNILDEELKVPNGSSTGFFNKLLKQQEQNPLFSVNMKADKFRFGVTHYAGDVSYDASAFLEKNKDSLFDDLLNALMKSSVPLIASVLDPASKSTDVQETNLRATRVSGKKSISIIFRGQLQKLMKTLYGTSPHYVRCIKPNPAKKARRISYPLVMEQLRYSGVFEAVTIRKSGYPFRYEHEVFWKRFKCLVRGIDSREHRNEWRFLCKMLIETLGDDLPDAHDCLIGNSLVLYRSPQNKSLEYNRGVIRLTAVLRCQESIRFGVTRIRCLRWRNASRKLRAAYDTQNLEELKLAIEYANNEASGQNAHDRTRLGPELVKARQLKGLLEERKRISAALKVLLGKPPLDNIEELGKYLERAAAIDYTSEDVVRTVRVHKKAVAAVQAREELIKATEGFDFEKIVSLSSAVLKAQADYSAFGLQELERAKRAQQEIEQEWTTQLPQLIEALKRGAVCVPSDATKAGEWVEKSISSIRVDHLDTALLSGQNAKLKSSRGKDLVATLKLMKRVRSALLDSKWVAALKNLDECSNIDTAVEDEVVAIRTAFAIQTHLPILLNAIQRGQAAGLPPSSIDTIDSNSLSEALVGFESFSCNAPDIESLVDACNFVLKIRVAWKEDNWDLIENLLENEDIERLHVLASSELKLASANVHYYKLMERGLRRVLDECVKGAVGNLDSSSANLDETNKLVGEMELFDSVHTEFDKMKATLKLLVKVRDAVRNEEWDLLERFLRNVSSLSVVEDASQELTLCRDHVQDISSRQSLERGLLSGNISGPKGEILQAAISVDALQAGLDACTGLKRVSQLTETMVRCGTFVFGLRTAVREDNWGKVEAIFAVNDVSLASCVDQSLSEVLKARDEMYERQAIELFRRGFACDQIVRVDEVIDKGSIGTGAIDQALSFALAKGCGGALNNELSKAALLLKQIRLSLKGNDWNALRLHLKSLGDKSFKHSAAEIEIARNEFMNREFSTSLTEALKEGGPVGPIGLVAIELIDTIKLEKMIVKSEKIDPLLSRSKLLLHTCRLVLKNRKAIASDNWDDLTVVSELSKVADVSHPEFERVRKEKNNHHLITSFMIAIRQGRVRGKPGQLQYADINVTKLDECFTLEKSLGIRSDQARVLNEEALLLHQVRVQCRDSSWDQLSLTIASAESFTGVLSEGSKMELQLATKHYHNYRFLREAQAALESGSALGLLGSMDCDSVDMTKLDDALAYDRRYGCHSDAAKSKLLVCKELRYLRDSIRRTLWDKVPDILQRLRSLSQDNLPNEVVAEIKRVQDEVDHQNIIKKLEHGLKAGRIAGKVGHLEKERIQWEDLQTGLTYADTVECKTPLTKRLKVHAEAVLQIRKSLKTCLLTPNMTSLWKTLEKDLSLASQLKSEEVMSAKNELHNYLNVQSMIKCLSSGNVTGSLENFRLADVTYDNIDTAAKDAESKGCNTAEAKFLFNLCQQVASLRRHVLNSNWELVKSVALTIKMKTMKVDKTVARVCPGEITSEIDLCEKKAIDNLLIDGMTNALSKGKVTGPPLSLDIQNVKTAELEKVITKSEGVGCCTDLSKSLLSMCKSVVALRYATKDKNWSRIEEALGAENFKQVGDNDVCCAEVLAVRAAFEEYQVLQSLKHGLQEGRPIKRPENEGNNLDLSTADTARLEEALSKANELGCKTQTSISMKALAERTLNIRRCLECGELKKAGSEAEMSIRNGISSKEILDVQDEYRNSQSYDLVATALLSGQVKGALGNRNISTIDTSRLDQAIEQGDSVRNKTSVLKSILNSAKFVVNCRVLLRKQKWKELEAAFQDIGYNLDSIWEKAHPELSSMLEELNDQKINAQLLVGLDDGAVTGSVGSLHLADVNSQVLQSAVEAGEKLRAISFNTGRVLESAKKILSMRQCINREMWDTLKMSVDSTDENGLSPRKAAIEFNLIKYELIYREAIEGMEVALAKGTSFVDEDGSIMTREVDTTPIRDAAAFGEVLLSTPGVVISSAKFHNLLRTSSVVGELRSAANAKNWELVKSCVEKCIVLVENQHFYSGAVEEVNRAENFYFGWKIKTVLKQSLLHGRIRLGSTGDLLVDSVERKRLQADIESLEDMETSDSEAISILREANFILHLRTALLSDDWESFTTLLDENGKTEQIACQEELETAYLILHDLQLVNQIEKALDVLQEDDTLLEPAYRSAKNDHKGGTSDKARLYVEMTGFIISIRSLAQEGRWGDLQNALLSKPMSTVHVKMHSMIDKEFTRISTLSINRQIQTSLHTALEEGGPSGELNDLDTSSIELGTLEKSIAFAVKHLEELETANISLLRTARYVHTVRSLMKKAPTSNDLPKLVSKEKVDSMDLEARDELILVYHHACNLKASESLKKGLMNGTVEGTYVELNTDMTSVDEIRRAIEDSSVGFELTSASKHLLEVANFVELLRTHVTDTAKLGALIANAPEEIHDCAISEVTLIRDYYLNLHLRCTLENMFAEDLPTREELMATIVLAEKLTRKDKKCKTLLNSSQCLLDIYACDPVEEETWVPEIKRALNKSEEYGKDLHPSVVFELSRVRTLLEDKQASHILREAIRTGGPVGTLGMLDVDSINTHGLEAAIKDVESFIDRSSTTDTLLRSARILRIARLAMKDHGTWEDVERFESVCKEAKEELSLVRAHLWNRKMQKSLTDALNRGKVIGRVGHLRTEVVNTESLAIAVATCDSTHKLAPLTTQLLASAELVLHLRRGIVGKVIDSHDLRTRIECFAGTLSDAAKDEVQLIRAEIELNAALNEMRSALEQQSLSTLTEAIAKGEQTDHLNGDGRQLLRLARLMERLLLAEKDADWVGIQKVLATVDESQDVLPTEIVMKFYNARVRAANHSAEILMSEALSSNQIKGSVGSLDLSEVSTDRIDKALMATRNIEELNDAVSELVRAGIACRECRRAVRSDKWHLLTNNPLMNGELHAPEIIAEEITLLQDCLRERAIFEGLQKSILSDPKEGTTPFEEPIALAKRDGCVTELTRLLYDSACIVYRIRQLIMQGEWIGLMQFTKNQVLDVIDIAKPEVNKAKADCEHYSKTVLVARQGLSEKDWPSVRSALALYYSFPAIGGPTVDEEMRAIQHEADDKSLCEAFQAALSRGGATGTAGRVITASIRLTLLEKSLELAMDLGCNSSEAQSFYRTGRALHQLRVAARQEDWLEVEHLLAACVPGGIQEIESGTSMLDPIVNEEVSLYINHSIDLKMVTLITEALENGAIRTDHQSGEVNASTINAKPLGLALTYANEKGCRSAHAEQLVAAATLIHRVRTALMSRDWNGVFEVVKEASGTEMCRLEMSSALNAVSNFRSSEALRVAIETNCVLGLVGKIDTSEVSLVALDKALEAVRDAGTASKRVEILVNTAHVVRRLRHAVSADDWEETETVISDAAMLAATNSFAKEAEAEMNLCLEEVEDRKLQKLLFNSIASKNRQLLQQAIELAHTTMLVHSEATRTLLTTAMFLNDLREAYENGEMNVVETIFASRVQNVNLTDSERMEAEEFVAKARDATLIMNLEAAIKSAGRAVRVNGGLDTTSLSRSRLLLAISDAKQSKALSKQALLLLEVTTALSDMRGHLRNKEWAHVVAAMEAIKPILSKKEHLVPAVALEEMSEVREEATKFLMDESYSNQISEVMKVQAVARQRAAKREAVERSAACLRLQSIARMFLCMRKAEKLRMARDQDIIDRHEEEKEQRRAKNIEKWNLAATMITEEIAKGLDILNSPSSANENPFPILSEAYKRGRKAKLHFHPEARVIAYMILCERALKQLLEQDVHGRKVGDRMSPRYR